MSNKALSILYLICTCLVLMFSSFCEAKQIIPGFSYFLLIKDNKNKDPVVQGMNYALKPGQLYKIGIHPWFPISFSAFCYDSKNGLKSCSVGYIPNKKIFEVPAGEAFFVKENKPQQQQLLIIGIPQNLGKFNEKYIDKANRMEKLMNQFLTNTENKTPPAPFVPPDGSKKYQSMFWPLSLILNLSQL